MTLPELVSRRLRRVRLPAGAFGLVIAIAMACSQSGPHPTASPNSTSSPSSREGAFPRPIPIAHRAAAAAILEDGEVGLPRIRGRDHVGLAQAAEEEQNQPLALMRYRRWGWLDQATRTWSAGDRSVDEELLVLTSAQGARLAFADASGDAGGPSGLACKIIVQVDDCSMTGDTAAAQLVARLGPYFFRLRGVRFDPTGLAALAGAQSARLRRP